MDPVTWPKVNIPNLIESNELSSRSSDLNAIYFCIRGVLLILHQLQLQRRMVTNIHSVKNVRQKHGTILRLNLFKELLKVLSIHSVFRRLWTDYAVALRSIASTLNTSKFYAISKFALEFLKTN